MTTDLYTWLAVAVLAIAVALYAILEQLDRLGRDT